MSNWSFMSNFTNLSGMLSGTWGDGDSNPLEDGDSDPVETELCSMDKPLGGLADDNFDSTQYRNGLPDTPPLRAMSPEIQYELNETGDHVEDRLKESVTSVGSDKDDKGGMQENIEVDEYGGNQGDDKGCIFVVNDKPLQFFIPPSKEKKALRELIQKAGGKVVRRPTKEVFYILPTDEKMLPGVQHVLRADYVYECVKANKLLNVYKYGGSEPVDTMLPADSPMDTQDSSMNAPDDKAAVTNTSGSESVDAGEPGNDTADKTGANASTPSNEPDVLDKDVYDPLDECLKELGTKQNKDLWVTLDIKIKTPDQETAKAGEAKESSPQLSSPIIVHTQPKATFSRKRASNSVKHVQRGEPSQYTSNASNSVKHVQRGEPSQYTSNASSGDDPVNEIPPVSSGDVWNISRSLPKFEVPIIPQGVKRNEKATSPYKIDRSGAFGPYIRRKISHSPIKRKAQPSEYDPISTVRFTLAETFIQQSNTNGPLQPPMHSTPARPSEPSRPQEATKLPDPQKATKLPDPHEATNLPDPLEATKLPDPQEATKLPDPHEATKLPAKLGAKRSPRKNAAPKKTYNTRLASRGVKMTQTTAHKDKPSVKSRVHTAGGKGGAYKFDDSTTWLQVKEPTLLPRRYTDEQLRTFVRNLSTNTGRPIAEAWQLMYQTSWSVKVSYKYLKAAGGESDAAWERCCRKYANYRWDRDADDMLSTDEGRRIQEKKRGLALVDRRRHFLDRKHNYMSIEWQ